jgi:hypothetical protein
MLKVHYQTDHKDLVAACDGVMWQLFEDRFVKSAASDLFTREELAKHAPDKDHFMMHLIAMGDQECFGPNKNGDGFPAEALEKRSSTFVSDGCFFREHRNRDQEKEGIGKVKVARYTPDMHRTEIILHGHRKKAAEEYELAKSGKPLSFSMSCRVPYDICNCCEKRSSNPRDYCGHLKSSMLQYLPEFRKYAFAINDKPTFFDISRVRKPADRIAHYLEYRFPEMDATEKAASAERIITGTEWAEYEGVCIPDDSPKWPVRYHRAIEKLAAAEQYLEDYEELCKVAQMTPKAYFATNIVPYAFNEKLSDQDIDTLRGVELGELCGELAKRAAILPFPEFVSLMTGQPREKLFEDPVIKLAASIDLKNIIGKLMSGGLPGPLAGLFDAGMGNGLGSTDEVQQIMDKADEKFCCKMGPTRGRVIQIITIKNASERFLVTSIPFIDIETKGRAQALAEAYGVYKIAAMTDIMNAHGDEIDEPQFLLAVAQNKFIYR